MVRLMIFVKHIGTCTHTHAHAHTRTRTHTHTPVVSKHCELVDIRKLSISLPSKTVPQVGSEYLRSLEEEHGSPSIQCCVSVAGKDGG